MLLHSSIFRQLRLLWYLELFPIVFMVANALRCGKGVEALNSLVPVILLMLAIYSLGLVVLCSVWSRTVNRIVAAILLSLAALWNSADLFTYLYFGNSYMFYNLSMTIGYLVPGILGREMEKQGVLKTLGALTAVTLIIRLVQIVLL